MSFSSFSVSFLFPLSHAQLLKCLYYLPSFNFNSLLFFLLLTIFGCREPLQQIRYVSNNPQRFTPRLLLFLVPRSPKWQYSTILVIPWMMCTLTCQGWQIRWKGQHLKKKKKVKIRNDLDRLENWEYKQDFVSWEKIYVYSCWGEKNTAQIE